MSRIAAPPFHISDSLAYLIPFLSWDHVPHLTRRELPFHKIAARTSTGSLAISSSIILFSWNSDKVDGSKQRFSYAFQAAQMPEEKQR